VSRIGLRTAPLALLVALAVPASASVGDGVVIAPGLWVAGDVSVEGEVPRHGPASVALDDVSLLARWEPSARLALFTEVRLEDVVDVIEGEGADTGQGDVALERAYVEALLTPSLSVRAGKVFTPFGLWNVIRRAPLTWTVERPAATEAVFPEHATGLSLLQQTTWRGWILDATGYGPVQDEPTFRHSDEKGWLVGGRVGAGRAVDAAFASLGVSAAGFRSWDAPTWTTATGLDVEVALAGQQLTGELTFRIPGDGRRMAQGLYIQDAIPLAPVARLARDLYAVLRFECFQPGRGGAAVGQLVGLFWRPRPWLVLRADYLATTRALQRLEPGLQASISFLL
jgi:hypothetical protein